MKHKGYGFTLVELLTTVAIIAMLIGLLIPAISYVRLNAKNTAQRAQFNTMGLALMSFKNDYGDYPPSNWPLPPDPGSDYCGAQKLAEALLGWDLKGFHPDSAWDGTGTIYDMTGFTEQQKQDNLNQRVGPYLDVSTANAFSLGNSSPGARDGLFGNVAPLAPKTFVICDVFGTKKITFTSGQTAVAGTPILYFKANTTYKNITHPDYYQRTYNIYDNLALLGLGKIKIRPSDPTIDHPFAAPLEELYKFDNDGGIKDSKIVGGWPHRPDSYILISAGADGLYGTSDDIRNFDK